jgi:hypothetical protein
MSKVDAVGHTSCIVHGFLAPLMNGRIEGLRERVRGARVSLRPSRGGTDTKSGEMKVWTPCLAREREGNRGGLEVEYAGTAHHHPLCDELMRMRASSMRVMAISISSTVNPRHWATYRRQGKTSLNICASVLYRRGAMESRVAWTSM